MSVYTSVTEAQLECFLSNYSLGSLQAFEGISAGIENTNYFVDCDQGRYVLTLFESLNWEELPYFLDLMAYLNEQGIPCAHPVADKNGHYLRQLNDRPATLVQRLQGASVNETAITHCRSIGGALGRMHRAGVVFDGVRNNCRGHQWRKSAIDTLLPLIAKQHPGSKKDADQDIALLKEEIRLQSLYQLSDLPRGVIHADLFRDNALFANDQLTGIIDFYYACNDVLLYDIAVAVNDWCVRQDGVLDFDKTKCLLSMYHNERPLTAIERGAWPVVLRMAALRFWLSRLVVLYFPRDGLITQYKDPDEFKRILIARIDEEARLDDVWPQ